MLTVEEYETRLIELSGNLREFVRPVALGMIEFHVKDSKEKPANRLKECSYILQAMDNVLRKTQ